LRKTIPAHGLFAHHVQGISLRNIQFETKSPDARPAVTFQDVTEIKTDDSLVLTILP
jgi:hypothetical protein